MNDTGATVRLGASGRYDGARLLAFLGAHAVPGVEHWDGTTYTRSLATPAGPAVISLTAAGSAVLASVHGGDRSVLPRVRHLLCVTTDTAAAERHLSDDPLLGASVRTRPGLRSPGSIDDGETLVRTVVGQQVSVAGARTVLGRIAAQLGTPLPPRLADGAVRLLFPSMAALAVADPLHLPMPRGRARAVVACASAVSTSGLPDAGRLLALPGVGPWTADYVDLRCRQAPDVFLASDLAVRRVLERAGLDGSPRAAAALATRWAPYRSTALIHLWTTYLEERLPAATSRLISGSGIGRPR